MKQITKSNAVSRRYYEFDMMRALCMLFMVVAHVWEQYEWFMTPELAAQYHRVAYFYIITGPSTFMICMGVNLIFTNHKTPREIASRGVRFLCLDVFLNVMRFGIPVTVLALLGRPDRFSYFATNLLRSDIYAFVGLFFLIYAVCRYYKLSSFWLVCISFGMLTVNTLFIMRGINELSLWNTYWFLGDLAGRVIWVDWDSYFSLLPWFVFPITGLIFGKYYFRLNRLRQNHFSRQVLIFSVIGFTSFSVFLPTVGLSWRSAVVSINGYLTDVVRDMVMILCTGILFGICQPLAGILAGTKMLKWIVHFSKLVIPFYVIQWIIVGWGQFTMDYFHMENFFQHNGSVFGLAAAIIVLSTLLAELFYRYTERKRQ